MTVSVMVTSRDSAVNVSLTPELEHFVEDKIDSGLYNNASEVVRDALRLLKEQDEIRGKWREQIERGWIQAQAGHVVDGPKVIADMNARLKPGLKIGTGSRATVPSTS
jgi:antitoxin ParD1/3/4